MVAALGKSPRPQSTLALVRAHARTGVDDVLDEVTRELHDQVAQTLNLLLVEMERFKREQTGQDSVVREMEFLQTATRQALINLRQVVFDLRTEAAPSADLPAAMEELRRRVFTLGIRDVRVTIDEDWPQDLPPSVGFNLLRVVQEAAINAVRHSGCRSLRIDLSATSEYLTAHVADDGKGIDFALLETPTLGMTSMRERAAIIGGDLMITSTPERGTLVTLTVPMEKRS